MNRTSLLHDAAMRAADEKRYSAAAALEQNAARRCRVEPSRSILFRSAAGLAQRAGATDQARALAREGLRGTPPADIRAELEELLAACTQAAP